MHDTSAVMVIAGAGSTHFYGKAGMQEIYYSGYEDAVNVFRPSPRALAGGSPEQPSSMR